MSFSRMLYNTCAWRLINVCDFQYHGLINLVGNQRNVTMAAYGKLIGGLYPCVCVSVVCVSSVSVCTVLVCSIPYIQQNSHIAGFRCYVNCECAYIVHVMFNIQLFLESNDGDRLFTTPESGWHIRLR